MTKDKRLRVNINVQTPVSIGSTLTCQRLFRSELLPARWECTLTPCAGGNTRERSSRLSIPPAEDAVMTLLSCEISLSTRLPLREPRLRTRGYLPTEEGTLSSARWPYCAAQGWAYQVITDVGSGLNYHQRGLKQLISQICLGEIARLVLTHTDRLLRLGSELVFSMCDHFGVEVVIINASEDSTIEEELAGDVIEIVTVLSARLYGSRSPRNRRIMEQLREVGS